MVIRNNSVLICLLISGFLLISDFAFTQQLISGEADTSSIHKTDTNLVSGQSPIVDEANSIQPPELNTNNSFVFGIGTANMYDTYLSPLEYKGISFRVYNEQMRRTTWFDYQFYKQQIIDLEFAKGDNPAKNATEYWILGNYRLGGHYTVYNSDGLRVGIGGLGDFSAGVLYNDRNGNNPASARGYANFNLSAIASYKMRKMAVRWQIDSPIAGVLCSYRQSYYEIYLGNTTNMVYFASLHNQRALRNYLSVDIPIKNYTIRVGYLGSFYQTKVNGIQTHHYTNTFLIGFPMEGVKKQRTRATNNYWD